jgi:hypothetical protein
MPTIPIRWADNTNQLRANLRQGLDQIEATKAAADRMTQSLGGGKLIAAAHNFAAAVQQIGGVERLTNAERERGNALLDKAIEKYRVLGQTAPKSLRDLAAATKQSTSQAFLLSDALANVGLSLGAGAGAALGSGLVLGVRHALELSDALSKLSDRTGITATGLQRLDAIARPSGNTIEEIANAINRFQKNIIEGGKDTENALARIGLSIRDLESLEPDQQFIEIAKGIQSIKDPAEQAFVAMQLFGRAGAELLPSLKAKVDELADSTFKMSDKAVKAWDDVGDAVQRWKTNVLNAIGEVLAQLNRPGTDPLTALLLASQEGAANLLIPRPKAPQAPLSGERGNIPLFAVPGLPPPEVIASIERFSKALLRAAEAQLAAKGLADQWARIAKFEDVWGKLAAQPRQTFTPFSSAIDNFATFEIDLGNIDNLVTQTFDDMIQKAKELEEAFRKAFGVTAGLSLGLPPGVVPGNTDAIQAARGAFGIDDGAFQRTQIALDSLSQSVSMLGSMSDGAFGKVASLSAGVVDGIANMLRAVETFKDASLSSMISIGSAAFQLGMIIGQLLAPLLRSLFTGPGAIGDAARRAAQGAAARVGHAAAGGIVTNFGIQRFAYGGPVMSLSAPSTDTVPAMLTPGEWVLNKQQQRDVFGGGGVTHHHYDLRNTIITDMDGLTRKMGKLRTRHIAENKDSSYSRGRAAYGLKS